MHGKTESEGFRGIPASPENESCGLAGGVVALH